MKKNEIKKGMIVVVEEGVTFGNKPQSITKVLGKPGEVNDKTMLHIGKRNPDSGAYNDLVLCEDVTRSPLFYSGEYRNKPSLYEDIHDLRKATVEEKEQYHKSKRKANAKKQNQ